MALLPSNPRDQRLVVVMLFAVALAAVYYMYVYSPKNEELATVESRLETLRKSNERAKLELAKGNVDELRAQAVQYEQNLQLMRQLVPTSNEVPALLEQVSTAARRVGLDLAEVQPEPVIVGDQFDTYRYKLGVIGSYHSLAEFLTNVGSLTRIIAPLNVQLAPLNNQKATAARKKEGQSVLDATFYIQTYVAKAETPTEAAQRGKNGARS